MNYKVDLAPVLNSTLKLSPNLRSFPLASGNAYFRIWKSFPSETLFFFEQSINNNAVLINNVPFYRMTKLYRFVIKIWRKEIPHFFQAKQSENYFQIVKNRTKVKNSVRNRIFIEWFSSIFIRPEEDTARNFRASLNIRFGQCVYIIISVV